jgi:pyrimidine operon attenuation protein / uracil phosphoribosyltransferase
VNFSAADSDFDAEVLYQQLLTQLRAAWPALGDVVQLVGIASGGVWVAERLRDDLGLSGPVGVVSSSMHRDDFAQRGLAASAMQTTLPFEVDGATVVLVDDVLHTGRTLRAVINELFDYGRPARVALAVLVDRGDHQLPVAADWCAQHHVLSRDTVLSLSRDEQGRFAFQVEAA